MARYSKSLSLALALSVFLVSHAMAALDGERIVDLILSYMELEGLAVVERPAVSVSGDTVTLGAMRFVESYMQNLGLDPDNGPGCPPQSCVELPMGLILEGVEPEGSDTFTAETLTIGMMRGTFDELEIFEIGAKDISVSPVMLAPVSDVETEAVMDGLHLHLARHHDGAREIGALPRAQTITIRHLGVGVEGERFATLSDFTQVSAISEDLLTYNEVTTFGSIDFTPPAFLQQPYPIVLMSTFGIFALDNLSGMTMTHDWQVESGIESISSSLSFGELGTVGVTAAIGGMTPHAFRVTAGEIVYDDLKNAPRLTLESAELEFAGPEFLDAWLSDVMLDDAPPFAEFVERMDAPSPAARTSETEAVADFLSGEAGLRITFEGPVPVDHDVFSSAFAINPANVFVPGAIPELHYQALP